MKSRLFLPLAVVALLLIGTFFVAVIVRSRTPSSLHSGNMRVATSFYPLYFFASQIGGDKISVTTITPAGAEPHDYEPSTEDIAGIERSRLLILNGQIEPWEDKIREDLKDKKTMVIAAAEGLISDQDPHVWLDPVLAKNEAQVIASALETSDPTNAAVYQSNMSELGKKLDSLNLDFQKGLAKCQQKNIVTSHAAFAYIAKRYNFTQTPIAGLSPDSEPSPQKLAEITKFTKENNVKYIFFESLVSPRLAQTLATETGAKTIEFNPLEGLTHEEDAKGIDYFLQQRQNLANLKIALSCQ